ncbi:MAG: ATP-binding cassette domain-containing protein [Bacilli bacterium]
MNTIEIKNLTKFYGKARGIKNVSLNVEEGEVFGFIGPNGAGKSTTIRAMLGLIKSNEGSIAIFGKNIENSLVEVLNDIGYLPSEVFYYDKTKAIDLLKYSASFYDGNFEERIKYLANYLDLDLNMKVDSMSYGNKKKVGIIQGLLHSPKLIILDEPTGGLDPLMQQKFFDLIKEENMRGATVLFSSHILGEVQRMCDRVAIIKEGEIVAIETIKNLTNINIKYVDLIVNSEITENLFSEEDIKDFSKKDNNIKFTYTGDLNDLLKLLRKVDIADLVINEPDLEDIFMHYYG